MYILINNNYVFVFTTEVCKGKLNFPWSAINVFTYFMPLFSFYHPRPPLKILKSRRFSDDFMGYRKRSLAWNRLISTDITNQVFSIEVVPAQPICFLRASQFPYNKSLFLWTLRLLYWYLMKNALKAKRQYAIYIIHNYFT